MMEFNRPSEGQPFLRTAEALVRQVDDPFIQITVSNFIALSHIWKGRFSEATEVVDAFRGVVERGGVVFHHLFSLLMEAWARGGKGEYEQALIVLDTTLEHADRVGEVFVHARVLNTIGWIYSELQDPKKAMEWNARCMRFMEEVSILDPEIESNARLNLGDTLLTLGRVDEAEEHCDVVENIVRAPTRPEERMMAWRYSQHLFHSYGELWLVRGDYGKALAYADECLKVAEETESRKNIVKGRRLRGEVFLAQGNLEEAEGEIKTALEEARGVGNPTQLWKTCAALGDLRREQGRPEDGRQAYREALSVIEKVAKGFADDSRRETFLNSSRVRELRSKARV
jgi:tetratricopeptide (TPR) repeat protein